LTREEASVWRRAMQDAQAERPYREHDADLGRGIAAGFTLHRDVELLKREVAELVRWRQSQESK
jgi:hypothetical protein